MENFKEDEICIDREKWDKLSLDEMYGYANRNMVNAEKWEKSLIKIIMERDNLKKEIIKLNEHM